MGAIYTPTMTLEFWEDLSGLPSSINPKAIRTIHKMLKDPWSKELRPEKIEQAEKGIHSCRVDDGYRLIWKHIKPDNIVFCLVDNHDEAYRRARRKSFQLEDGIVKVVDILSAGKTEKYKNMDDSDDPEAWLRAIRKEPGKLFAGYLNDELIDMGVSEDNIANVRLLDSPDDLDLIERLFDEETYENLFYAALGETERSTVPDKELNKSLERYRGGDELYKFVDSDEFQRALQGDLEAWMLFLSPNQRQIALRDYNGPARVKGVAGSGKTVIAIHRVYHMYKLARDKDVKNSLFDLW